MTQGNSKHSIRPMEFISEDEYHQIKQLQAICYAKDQTNLKLELDYKLYIGSVAKSSSNKISEFLYYVDDTLVAYLGISCFGENKGELNGMTHPDFRGDGIFDRLFALATNECKYRNFSKVVLLSDGNSSLGIEFIKSVGGIYDSSEYRMKLNSNSTFEGTYPVTLRIATKEDHQEIAKQNAIFFNDPLEESESTPFEENAPNIITYMIELSGTVIGKVLVEYGESSAFLFGFGILPDYRRKGYGKASINETLRIIKQKNISEIELDVVCINSNALNLYKSCGFEQVSIMNYYEYPMNTIK